MIRRIFNWLCGRHTAFAVFFTITGTVLACYNRLPMSYVALVGAIQSFVFAHSYKEDHFEQHDDHHDDHKGVS